MPGGPGEGPDGVEVRVWEDSASTTSFLRIEATISFASTPQADQH